MLFNSFEFIAVFLPCVFGGYALANRWGRRELGLGWLVAASLFFYGWWNPLYVPLLVGSMLANYALGRGLARPSAGRGWLTVGVAGNLTLLGWFKYADFLAHNLMSLGLPVQPPGIVLPLAISFFTFQQIAYLVDARRGLAKEPSLLHYALFVTFFPQLIAGPIVHHADMLPQFLDRHRRAVSAENVARGVAIFVVGLFKKVVLADTVAAWASPVFNAAAAGALPDAADAWGGALAYTLQIYFDFSGYTDMAIGAAWLFGIRLPENFAAPYRSTSIIDFWRTWHMTLSRFLRDYLYIPLGGNRHGTARRYLNLWLTMLLGGLWHGAGWTFVVWGALHGLYLSINHAWNLVCERIPGWSRVPASVRGWIGGGVTLLAVIVAWVFFRAAHFSAAGAMLAGGVGLHGPTALGFDDPLRFVALAALFVLVWTLPTTASWMHEAGRLRFAPSVGWAGALAAALVVVLWHSGNVSEFIYFQF